jgi:hypothetical protein
VQGYGKLNAKVLADLTMRSSLICTKWENRMGVTIWFLILLALPVILYLYENKQQQAYLAELELLDEPYMRLLETGVLSASANNHEHRP